MEHILVIEDETDVRELICTLLESCGYKTSSAECGKGALEFVAESAFDLVLTDLVMPGMEGVETMIALKRVAPDLRVIAMSGNGGYLDLARRIGASEILLKPFSREKLHETIQAVLAA